MASISNSSRCNHIKSFDDKDCCWICLDDEGPLHLVCSCPHPVHRECLARWQLQKAGQREEHRCRFCCQPYPDWRELAPQDSEMILDADSGLMMTVGAGCKVVQLMLVPGPRGKALFRKQVRMLLGHGIDDADIVFECTVPWSGETVQLVGLGAFDAAAHCAAVAAARRSLRRRRNEEDEASFSGLILLDNEPPSVTPASPYSLIWRDHDLEAFESFGGAAPTGSLGRSAGGEDGPSWAVPFALAPHSNAARGSSMAPDVDLEGVGSFSLSPPRSPMRSVAAAAFASTSQPLPAPAAPVAPVRIPTRAGAAPPARQCRGTPPSPAAAAAAASSAPAGGSRATGPRRLALVPFSGVVRALSLSRSSSSV